MKKLISEFIGTAVLVTLGCGTAMLVGCDAASGGGYILTALAFGLVIVGPMAGAALAAVVYKYLEKKD